MATTVDWITGVITVPRADMTLLQSVPTEIRQLETNLLRAELRDLEDDVDGRPWPRTHDHNEDVLVGGVELADVLILLDPYTITFEDGLYAVNLQGTNNNILEKNNKNQVSVNPSNSAGLVNSAAIEFGEYGGVVTIDQGNTGGSAVSGTLYPIGTLRRPVDNIPDGITIASVRGFKKLVFINSSVSISTGDDVEDMIIYGLNPTLTTITIDSPALTTNCSIQEATVQGVLDGGTQLIRCTILDITYFNGFMDHCTFQGTIILGGSSDAHMVHCFSGLPGALQTPVIDLGGSGNTLSLRDYNGGINFINKTGNDAASVDLNSGQVILASSFGGDGDVVIRGVGNVYDNGTSTNTKIQVIASNDILAILRLTGNNVTRVGDIITIYEEDEVTIWRQIDLSNGGRITL